MPRPSLWDWVVRGPYHPTGCQVVVLQVEVAHASHTAQVHWCPSVTPPPDSFYLPLPVYTPWLLPTGCPPHSGNACARCHAAFASTLFSTYNSILTIFIPAGRRRWAGSAGALCLPLFSPAYRLPSSTRKHIAPYAYHCQLLYLDEHAWRSTKRMTGACRLLLPPYRAMSSLSLYTSLPTLST